MTRARILRRFAPWLAGLFLIAQFAGVVPLIAAHTLHVFENKQVISGEEGVTAVGLHGTHHHGLNDLNDQCCAFQQLTGVLSYVVKVNPVRIAKPMVASLTPIALVVSDPLLPDRPPKSLSLI